MEKSMNKAAFFDSVRGSLFEGKLSQSKVEGLEYLLKAWEGQPLDYIAYGLATAYHETGHTMLPIREYGGPAYFRKRYDVQGDNPTRAKANGNTKPGDGMKYCGRGYVQLTWKNNYERAGKAIGVDLVNNPDLAMKPEYAARIMVEGMLEGWFTGKKLSDYLGGDRKDYVNARRIINGTDRASEIAEYARQFEAALKAAGVPS
mgnify:CR=1 FL=1